MSHFLNCVIRPDLGKTASKNYRKNGFIPCVIYMKEGENLNILVNLAKMEKLVSDFTFMTKTIHLHVYKDIKSIEKFASEGVGEMVQEILVLPKQCEFHKVTSRPNHFDFAQVKKDDVVKVELPIVFKNKDQCQTLKFGGTMVVLCYNPQVKCKVSDIPSHLDIDLSGLPAQHIVRLSNIVLPEGVKIIKDKDIAKISGKRGAVEKSE